jgi:hypothetical protein
MLQLMHALQDEGLDHWRVVARAWNVELPAQDPLVALLRGMLVPAIVADTFLHLPPDVQAAIQVVRQSGGRIPMAAFTHRFGELRAMGPARREREKPWLEPVSIAERLWYAGWIGRAFIRSGAASQEYAYLPSDLAALLPAGSAHAADGWRLLSYQPGKADKIFAAANRIAQDAGTLLAFLRNWPQPVSRNPTQWKMRAVLERHTFFPDALPLLLFLLRESGILTGDPMQPDAEAAPAFLDLPADEAAAQLREAWRQSAWNDLEHAGQWTAEAGWPNDPLASRQRFWDAFTRAPQDAWCTLGSFADAVREMDWEFLRPASSFEDWIVRDREGNFLRGMNSWDRMEGTLIREYLTGPMAWLGMAEIASSLLPQAFRRVNPETVELPSPLPAGDARKSGARVRVDGTVYVASDVSMMLRYRLARCSEWTGRMRDVFIYRITPRALALAAGQDIHIDHILPLLRRLGGEVPPALGSALRRWEQKGVEAVVRRERLLLPKNSETAARVIARLEANHGLARRIEGPVWVVGQGSIRKVRELLGEDGFLLDEEENV